ncbi:MAG TPA: peptide deformylase, partial [Acidimicrobiales bacterium]
YDMHDDEGPKAIINPVITESSGEWVHDEGCLSVPGLSWEITRPKEVHLTGFDLDGNELSIEADELLARMFQHELDHLDGVLLIDRLDPDQRKDAKRAVRELQLGLAR